MLENSSNEDIIKSSLAELAKASNELRCIKNDAEKVSNRVSFLLLLINTLADRLTDKQQKD